jgi:hypothetical protein
VGGPHLQASSLEGILHHHQLVPGRLLQAIEGRQA